MCNGYCAIQRLSLGNSMKNSARLVKTGKADRGVYLPTEI